MPRTSRHPSLLGRVLTLAGVLVSAALLAPPGAANATSPTCGTLTLHKANGSDWVCTFDDEFTGSTLDLSKWTVQQTATSGYTTGSPGTHVCYMASPNNISVANGYLALTVRKESHLVTCGAYSSWITGGTVSTFAHFSQTYGRFEVRAKFPDVTVAGLQETLWLWPVNSTRYGAQPASGEIDFAESYSQRSNLVVPYIHYVSAGYDPNVMSSSCTITLSAFHTYTLVWTTTTMTVSIDDKTCLVDTWQPAAPLLAPQPFDQPFFLVLTQALGLNANAYNPYSTPMPDTTYIDYARIWQ